VNARGDSVPQGTRLLHWERPQYVFAHAALHALPGHARVRALHSVTTPQVPLNHCTQILLSAVHDAHGSGVGAGGGGGTGDGDGDGGGDGDAGRSGDDDRFGEDGGGGLALGWLEHATSTRTAARADPSRLIIVFLIILL
jgi:hypothetical protein